MSPQHPPAMTRAQIFNYVASPTSSCQPEKTSSSLVLFAPSLDYYRDSMFIGLHPSKTQLLEWGPDDILAYLVNSIYLVIILLTMLSQIQLILETKPS